MPATVTLPLLPTMRTLVVRPPQLPCPSRLTASSVFSVPTEGHLRWIVVTDTLVDHA